MNAKQKEAIKVFKDSAKKVKRPFTFTLGMVTAFAIVGFFEAIEYRSIYEPSIPWWIFIIVVIVATIAAGKISER